jgi:SSS family solute:Na+ symporter
MSTFLLSAVSGYWHYVIFGAYLALIVTVAIICRKKSGTINGFLFANKGIGGWLSAFAYGTTYFSAVVFVGYAGKFGWGFGMGAVWIGIGNAVIGSLVAWLVLANRTRNMTQTLNSRTMPEFFEKRYQSKHIKLVASLVMFIFLLPYSASVYQGLGYIFEAVIGIPAYWCILILAAITALYLFMGGYFGTAVTDFIQGIIMIIGVVAMLFIFLGSPEVNYGEGLARLTENGMGFIPSAAVPQGKTFLDSPATTVIVLVLLTSFGIWALPQSVHKFYAIKDKAAIMRGTVISTLFGLIVGVGAYFIGSLITLFVDKPTLANELGNSVDRLIPYMLTNNLNGAMLGLVVVLLFSASVSTLAALSLSSSATVSLDFVKGYAGKNLPEKSINVLLRVLCILFVGVSAVLAILEIDAIVTMMSLSWGFLAGCFMGPYVLGLFSKKINKYGAYASIITTFVLTAALILAFGYWQAGTSASFAQVLKSGIGRSPYIGVASMAASLVVTPVFSFIFKDKNIDAEFLNAIFPKKNKDGAGQSV